MKYKNAKKVLPESLIEQIQQYVQGQYIYIPSKNEVPRPLTDYGIETRKRDEHIYTKHLEGMKNTELAKKYSLSESSIRRIIIEERKRYKGMKDSLCDAINRTAVCCMVFVSGRQEM